MHHPLLRFVMWASGLLSVFYFVGFTMRSFIRFYRREPGWGWLADLWSAVVVGTVLGGIAITLWLMLSANASP